MVDLGLSIKWATCNIGSESPEEYGDYYAWGETEEKNLYDGYTYKYYINNKGYINIGSKSVEANTMLLMQSGVAVGVCPPLMR